MSKSEKDILELGHKILVFQGTASLGTKPGYFDLWAGEEDIRRVIIDGENVDPNSDAYKDLCKKAYSDFAENKDAEKLLEKVENFYNALEEVAKKKRSTRMVQNLDQLNTSGRYRRSTSRFNKQAITKN